MHNFWSLLQKHTSFSIILILKGFFMIQQDELYIFPFRTYKKETAFDSLEYLSTLMTVESSELLTQQYFSTGSSSLFRLLVDTILMR